jgi:hypothetical protein
LLWGIIPFITCKKEEDTPEGKVTFNKDVKPIFEAKCSPCHLPGATGDSASIYKWNDYTTAKNNIDTILISVKLDPLNWDLCHTIVQNYLQRLLLFWISGWRMGF